MNDMIGRDELGSCRREFRMIFVDIYKHRMYSGGINYFDNRQYYNDSKYRREWRLRLNKSGMITHKMRYFEYMKVLVHELVHYRFPYLRHGDKFEKRIEEILVDGRTYPYRHVPKNGGGLPLYNCDEAARASWIYNRVVRRGDKNSYTLSMRVR